MAAIPEISVETLALRLRSDDQFVLLDVREPWELESARIADRRLVLAPMSSLSQLGLPALPEAARSPEADLFVICHHGVRSAQVTAWLIARGWTRAFSVSGGIDEYARKVDSAVGSY